MDVLSSSSWAVAWFENTDGQGSFGQQQIIIASQTDSSWPIVYAADLDGDGDMDMLSASWFDGKIAWYENTDGQGNFGDQQVITTQAHWAFRVTPQTWTAMVTSMSSPRHLADDKIAWYENTDGQGTFGDQQVITTRPMEPSRSTPQTWTAMVTWMCSPRLGDDNRLVREHRRQGNFGDQQVITNVDSWCTSVYAADLDGDGDMDVLSASMATSRLV